MRYISASGIHFKNRGQESGRFDSIPRVRSQGATNPLTRVLHRALFILLSLNVLSLLFTVACHSELLDRVVAIVDDEAIMLSELDEAYQKQVIEKSETTQDEVLNGLINRVLLLKQANKFSYGTRSGEDDSTLINEYINKQLRTFIRIPFEDIEQYYEKNKASLGDADFYNVRGKIEELLTEKELSRRLIKHIEELRKKTYIKIQVDPEN